MFPWSDDNRPRHRRRSKQFLERREKILSAWHEEVCSEELPEVEIISLLEEQIPRYRLRADTLTQFTGYENEDWYIPAPALKPEEREAALTPSQIRETLNYFSNVPKSRQFFNWLSEVRHLKQNPEPKFHELSDDNHYSCMNLSSSVGKTDWKWVRSGGDESVSSTSTEGGNEKAKSGDAYAGKLLTRQDSIHDILSKTLTRQNSLHDIDLRGNSQSTFSSDRSLSWDNFVDNYHKSTDEILEGLLEIREELRLAEETELSGGSLPCLPRDFSSDSSKINASLSVESHYLGKRNLSKSSSKNTRCSSDMSEFSYEGIWNSKQSCSLETYQSHQHRRPRSIETSSGITSISEDTKSDRKASSGKRSWVSNYDTSDDPYEYDNEPCVNVATTPPVDEELLAQVLCSERVSQMTKTYNDIEAVTRLLEEKEKDLELTARIGKELLSHNNKLESKVAALEAELKIANDKIEQITHELVKKTELIQVLTNDTDESGSEAGTPTALRCINPEFMQRRIKALEEENKSLRKEFAQLAKDAESCEEQEQRLVHDISLQLAHANVEVEGMSDDLERQKEENRNQHEMIVSLTAKLKDMEEKLNQHIVENEQLSSVLSITKENQNKLALELADFKDRYAEVMSLLQDAQEQLKRQRKKSMPSVREGLFSSLNVPGTTLPADCLASELDSSLYSELSLDSGISTDRLSNYKKVFDTVKFASKNVGSGCSSPVAPGFQKATVIQPSTVTASASAPRMTAFASYPTSNIDPARHAMYSSLSTHSLDSGGNDSESVTSDDITYPNAPVTEMPMAHGLPGVPGSIEIADALRRLTPAEVSARRAALGNNTPPFGGYNEYDATIMPLGCRTPDSIMSTGSSGYVAHHYWRLPSKLQIVKPMEGSQTLHHWSQLATPTLSGLLEERPGVKTKGGRGLEDIGLELYCLSDLEEDEEFVNPGKSFQSSGSVYTYTNSTVMHPDDNTSVTHSLVGSKVCTGATNSRQSTASNTPRCLSRRNSCSTFSMTLGLAKLLNERGIEATTASSMNTPTCDRSFSATATPANSPDGSPVQSRSPSPTPFHPLKLSGFLSCGAELLRRTFVSDSEPRSPRRPRRSKLALTRSERKALSSIKIMEKLESVGLETLIATTNVLPQPALQGSLYTRRGLPSPMSQIGLKNSLGSPSIDSGLSDLCNVQPAGLEMGVPARPGTGALSSRRKGKPRSDLGTVSTTVAASGDESSGPLGTLSSMFFGRKGGLF